MQLNFPEITIPSNYISYYHELRITFKIATFKQIKSNQIG